MFESFSESNRKIEPGTSFDWIHHTTAVGKGFQTQGWDEICDTTLRSRDMGFCFTGHRRDKAQEDCATEEEEEK